MRYRAFTIIPVMLALTIALVSGGCASGGGGPAGGGGPPPGGLSPDQFLSELAACQLLRVAQNGDKAVTDRAVISGTTRYGVSVDAVIQRANQMLHQYQGNGLALITRASRACTNLGTLVQVTPGLVRFGEDGRQRVVWLRVNSDISEGFADRMIRELRAQRAVGLVINSPGGSVFEARKLGRYLRANGLRTAVDGVCVSACIDLLAGGSERLATPTARLGIHQSRVPGAYSSHEGGQLYVAESFRYLREMGIDADVAIAAASIPNDKIFLIPIADALRTRLVTSVVNRL